jgi:hypothetical protein
MKAIIDVSDDAYVIRIYGKEGDLCDIHIVKEIKMSEFNSNVHETAAYRIV